MQYCIQCMYIEVIQTLNVHVDTFRVYYSYICTAYQVMAL